MLIWYTLKHLVQFTFAHALFQTRIFGPRGKHVNTNLRKWRLSPYWTPRQFWFWLFSTIDRPVIQPFHVSYLLKPKCDPYPFRLKWLRVGGSHFIFVSPFLLPPAPVFSPQKSRSTFLSEFQPESRMVHQTIWLIWNGCFTNFWPEEFQTSRIQEVLNSRSQSLKNSRIQVCQEFETFESSWFQAGKPAISQ